MLRDHEERPIDGGGWFVHHGTDVETCWSGEVPHRTPNERFFVRNHTEPPHLDPDAWRLAVTGDGVDHERTYALADLRAFDSVTVERALECTGNGRRLFAEQQGTPRPGTPWDLGAIGVATWTGVPLRTLLHDAGLRPDAVQVMAVGLDRPYVEDGVDHGRVRRPLPLAKALDDTLVVWAMNGEPLPPDHGFPARLLVPGWVGIASIKWLGELEVTTSVVESPWTTRWYRMHGPAWDAPDQAREDTVLTLMPPKSVLDTPAEAVAGQPTTLRGRAWSGEAAIARVEVSTDDGASWADATLVGPNEPSSWVHWELPWTPEPAPGEHPGEHPGDRPGEHPDGHTVLTRATDTAGRTQPDRAPDNDDGYLFSAVVRRTVRVRRAARGAR